MTYSYFGTLPNIDHLQTGLLPYLSLTTLFPTKKKLTTFLQIFD